MLAGVQERLASSDAPGHFHRSPRNERRSNARKLGLVSLHSPPLLVPLSPPSSALSEEREKKAVLIPDSCLSWMAVLCPVDDGQSLRDTCLRSAGRCIDY